MNKSTVRILVALITVFGHAIVFLFGLGMGVFSLLGGEDAIQTILMASPILSTTAFSAFSYMLTNEVDLDRSKVSIVYAVFSCSFPVVLILSIMGLFVAFMFQIDHFGPAQLKISLGSIETFFGAFLGMISKSLFGKSDKIAA